MSDQMNDKIVNHLIAYKILIPALSPYLIDQNVATRKGYGAKKHIIILKNMQIL